MDDSVTDGLVIAVVVFVMAALFALAAFLEWIY